MSQKPSYFKIGLFVISAIALVVVAIVIFGSGLFAEKKVYFETYFDSSVTGLSVGARVLNRGVVIGRVEKITFVRDEYEISTEDAALSKYYFYVMVIASVNQKNLPDITPEQRQTRLKVLIEKGLRLRLATNLLTGKGYLEANILDPERFPILPIKWKPKQLYVPSAPGEFTTIKDSIDQILHKLDQVDFKAIIDNLSELIDGMDQAIVDADIKTLSSSTIALIDEFQRVSADLKDLTDNLKKNPSQLIFSQPPPKSEVLK